MHCTRSFILLACFISLSLSLSCFREVNITGVERIGLGVLVNPETIVQDSQGFIYTGINDGSIRKVNPTTLEITTYAYSVPTLQNRTICGQPLNEPICGRVLGLAFDAQDNLYVADAYKGLLYVPRSNPSAVVVLSNSSDGVPFRFTNALAIDAEAGVIYFTDTSPTSYRFNFVKILLENKPEGRLLKYNIATGVTTTLLSGLRFANGVSMSQDKRFIVINELGTQKIIKYWIRDRNAGRSETFVNDIGGYNDNIELDHTTGNFIVGLFAGDSEIVDFAQEHQALAGVLNTYVPPAATIGMIPAEGLIKVVSPRGKIEKVLRDRTGASIAYIAEARRLGNYIYIGSVINPFLGRIPASLLSARGEFVCERN